MLTSEVWDLVFLVAVALAVMPLTVVVLLAVARRHRTPVKSISVSPLKFTIEFRDPRRPRATTGHASEET